MLVVLVDEPVFDVLLVPEELVEIDFDDESDDVPEEVDELVDVVELFEFVDAEEEK